MCFKHLLALSFVVMSTSQLLGEFSLRVIRSRAPLRLGLAGGGTDVSPYCDDFGGAILNTTIGYYAYATIEPLDNGMVEIFSTDQEQQTTFKATEFIQPDGTLDLLKHVYNYVICKFNHGSPLSLRLTTRVDVPSGSGLGGSSTLVVAVLKGFAEWLQYPIDDYELSQAAYVVERDDAGLQGGRQDQYAAAFGGFNFMEFGRDGHVLVNPLRIKERVISELEASILLYYTGSSRASADIIREQSRNVETRNPVALDAMHQIKQEAIRIKEALLRGNFDLLHEVLRSSWDAKKKMASDIVNKRIEMLYERALEAGAYSARISGAGGGGFMIFLTDPMRKDNLSRSLRSWEEKGTVYGCHFTNVGAQAWRVR
jgi:D-glycero-alpha-D-manno-heptose-7-phosphate kinase